MPETGGGWGVHFSGCIIYIITPFVKKFAKIRNIVAFRETIQVEATPNKGSDFTVFTLDFTLLAGFPSKNVK
jgi:hypothetical protein